MPNPSPNPTHVDPDSTRWFPEGSTKRIHVNQKNLRRRVAGTGTDPCFTIKAGGTTYWAHKVEILGPSVMIESIDKPLGCGARIWVETTSALRLE
jgi:hypothetical protein